MQTSRGSPSRSRPWVLLLGPGERLGLLPGLLASLPPGSEAPPESIRALEGLGELMGEQPRSGRLVLDAEALPLELSGLVQLFLEGRPGWDLCLLGDPRSAAARRLARLGRVRCLPWPPDLEELQALVGRAPEEAPERPPRAGAARVPAHGHEGRRERSAARLPAGALEEIERILSEPPPGGEPAPANSQPSPATPPTPATSPTPAPSVAPSRPAPYFRDQVADLADLAQRLELRTREARARLAGGLAEGAAGADGLARSLEELDLEAMRLVQFTRTLGFLAAPPPRGDQRIDLAAMVEELLAGSPPAEGGPRFLWRSEGPLWVRADKGLLAQALDAVLYLAQRCAGPGGTVRVEASSERIGPGRRARIAITFPAERLGGIPPERVLEPYALRRELPELGPNALAAARGILRGQDGALRLEAPAEGSLRWILTLPALEKADQ